MSNPITGMIHSRQMMISTSLTSQLALPWPPPALLLLVAFLVRVATGAGAGGAPWVTLVIGRPPAP
jgi:hypothetical protein